MSNNNKSPLTNIEQNDLQARVDRVRAYLKQSTSAWLSIASECYSAKQKLKQLAYEKFVIECGFTTSVADKLVKIGSCPVLHTEDKLPLVSSAEGWTVLYELSKLDQKQISNLLDVVADNNEKKLTRELIHNFANNKPLDAKRLVVASIELDEVKLKSMSFEQFNEVQNRINALKSEIDRINAGFVLKSRNKTVTKISDLARANSNAMIVKTAA
jgi:hypothetical protein